MKSFLCVCYILFEAVLGAAFTGMNGYYLNKYTYIKSRLCVPHLSYYIQLEKTVSPRYLCLL